MTKGLNKSQLQIIAIIAMVMDHTALFLFPHMRLYYTFHIFGRMTIVIMSYFIAEGYYKTRNVNKYIIRMGIFAAAAQIPFYLYEKTGEFEGVLHFFAGNFYSRNVIFTLFIGLCLLTIIKSELHWILKVLAAFAVWVVTRHSDWGIYCLLWVIGFGIFHGRRGLQMCSAAAIVLFRVFVKLKPLVIILFSGGAVTYYSITMAFVQLGGLLAIIPLMLYNGERGNAPRLGFYIFYPAHLLVLAVIIRFLQ
ncbi:MAG: hypothetical protein J1G06_07590 [Oscillospiraceae bacterium]|nr:hypothetical protein [Oscillospiraceae bacterium]